MRVVGECFFWYRLTRVFPDKFQRAVKRLCCVCVCHYISSRSMSCCLVVLAQQQANVAEHFAYELTPYPATLFKDGYMCKPVQSNLYTSLASGLMDAALPTASVFVVDGGCLLHRIPWTRGSTLEHILQQHVQYTLKNFGQSAALRRLFSMDTLLALQ